MIQRYRAVTSWAARDFGSTSWAVHPTVNALAWATRAPIVTGHSAAPKPRIASAASAVQEPRGGQPFSTTDTRACVSSVAAKLAGIVFTAAFLARRTDRINELSFALLPVATVVGVVSGLILLEPDFGTALTLLLITGVMVFAAGLSYRYLIGIVLTAAPLLYVVLASAEYRRRRLLTFLDPWSDPLGDGFQLIQAQIAVGTGGLLGQGLMGGIQKLFYLPYPHTDFIYAVIAEETGLLGATAISLCFCVITWRGFRIATQAPDRFGALLAVGLTTMISLQAFINISVVLGLLPTKGIPLPFVSAGGSSLLVSMAGMGVLLNVSQHASMRT